MRSLKNEKGIALALVLVLSVIILATTAAVLYFVTQGTRSSGMERRFRTALEASQGGAEFMYEIIGMRGNPADVGTWCGNFSNCSVSPTDTCVPCSVDGTCNTAEDNARCVSLTTYNAAYKGLETKLNLPTYCWSKACNQSLAMLPGPGTESTYDVTFQLGDVGDTDPALQAYDVFIKVVDSTYGNTGASTDLSKGGVLAETGGQVVAPQLVFLYTIEVLSQDARYPLNPQERARTSILYAY